MSHNFDRIDNFVEQSFDGYFAILFTLPNFSAGLATIDDLRIRLMSNKKRRNFYEHS